MTKTYGESWTSCYQNLNINGDSRALTKEEYGCTCERDAEFIAPHLCPFKGELESDYETQCMCCHYCEAQCHGDI